jgi:electron transfer flavoprotein alpha subunit
VPSARGADGPLIAVLVEPDRSDVAHGLLGAAAGIATAIDGKVIAVTTVPPEMHGEAGAWGADAIVVLDGQLVAEDVARGVADWVRSAAPWAVLAPSTAWGREVAGRVAAHLGAGLAGNVDALSVDGDRLVAWKRTDEGRAVAEVVSSSAVQLATVRPDALLTAEPREVAEVPTETLRVQPRGRVRVVSRTRTGSPPT